MVLNENGMQEHLVIIDVVKNFPDKYINVVWNFGTQDNTYIHATETWITKVRHVMACMVLGKRSSNLYSNACSLQGFML